MLRKSGFPVALLIVSLISTAFSDPLPTAGGQKGLPWWAWVLIILVLLIVVLWWWLRSRRQEEGVATAQTETGKLASSAEAEEPAPKPVPSTPDDLKRIEGIGPKISSLLQAAGITTFAQLAETDVSRLREILAEAGLGALADPGTWPEQARLAAAGKWEELEALQHELKGGRRN